MNKIKWWGYLHKEGTLHAKRFFDERDMDDAVESPFVKTLVYPFEANSREEALEIIKSRV